LQCRRGGKDFLSQGKKSTAADARILLVEDDPGIRRFLELVVGRGGFIFDSAVDGAEALRLLKKNSYDLMLLDLMLPRFSGFEVIAALRKMKARPAVIVVTSNEANDLDPEIIASIVRKPFDLTELMTLVTETALAAARRRQRTRRKRGVQERRQQL
jgi:DNA-binding response OmpR family regulator